MAPWEEPDLGKDGAGDTSRTCDLLITNQLLYQLSYTGQIQAAFTRAGSISAFAGAGYRRCRGWRRQSRVEDGGREREHRFWLLNARAAT